LAAASAVALLAMTAGVASAAGPKGYDSVPKQLPGNVSSVGFQATQTNNFGDSVVLNGGSRAGDSVEVVMSSWGCESGSWTTGNCASAKNATFTYPITLNLYNVDPVTGQPTTLVHAQTETFAIPYRPSADPVNCTGANAGKWYDKADKTCYNGFATTIKFKLDDTVLPENVAWTVAYNTSGYGLAPYGYATACAMSTAGCAYDSLNVGAESFDGEPSTGTDVNEDQVVRNGHLENGYTGLRPLATIKTK
jgi:hypothetical protein